jgi:hypothetical protein
MVLSSAGNYKVPVWRRLHWHNFHDKSNENLLPFSSYYLRTGGDTSVLKQNLGEWRDGGGSES